MDHKELDAWKQAMLLAEEVYRISKGLPSHETYGLTSQMRRSAVSVPSNLSEGAARNGNKEFANFLGIALGSLAELETQVILASRLGYADGSDLLILVSRVRGLLIGLRKHAHNSMVKEY